MFQAIIRIFGALSAALLPSPAFSAVDSYRFMHVTISTPWYIFLFLLMGVFAPFILMMVLAWRNAIRRAGQKQDKQESTIE